MHYHYNITRTRITMNRLFMNLQPFFVSPARFNVNLNLYLISGNKATQTIWVVFMRRVYIKKSDLLGFLLLLGKQTVPFELVPMSKLKIDSQSVYKRNRCSDMINKKERKTKRQKKKSVRLIQRDIQHSMF